MRREVQIRLIHKTSAPTKAGGCGCKPVPTLVRRKAQAPISDCRPAWKKNRIPRAWQYKSERFAPNALAPRDRARVGSTDEHAYRCQKQRPDQLIQGLIA